MSGKDTSQLKKHGVNYENKSFSLSHDLLYITAILWSMDLRILTSCVVISVNQCKNTIAINLTCRYFFQYQAFAKLNYLILPAQKET